MVEKLVTPKRLSHACEGLKTPFVVGPNPEMCKYNIKWSHLFRIGQGPENYCMYWFIKLLKPLIDPESGWRSIFSQSTNQSIDQSTNPLSSTMLWS